MPYSPLELCEKLALFFGARVVPVLTNATTHIIVHPDQLERVPEIRAAMRQLLRKPPRLAKYLVSCEWLRESVDKHADLDEGAFVMDEKRRRQATQTQSPNVDGINED